jgi:hypothetical protein
MTRSNAIICAKIPVIPLFIGVIITQNHPFLGREKGFPA